MSKPTSYPDSQAWNLSSRRYWMLWLRRMGNGN